MPMVIVPVGFDSGPVWPLEPATEPEYYEVLVGEGAAELPADGYLVWGTAMLDRPAHAEASFERGDLLRLTSGDDRIPDPASTIQKLLNSGLLVEYDTDEPAKFLQNHRLYLLAEGSGNTQEHPESYQLSRRGEVVLELYHDVYAMLRGMPYATSIWAEIEGYASTPPADGPFTLDDFAAMVARTIPAVVATRCGYLQPS